MPHPHQTLNRRPQRPRRDPQDVTRAFWRAVDTFFADNPDIEFLVAPMPCALLPRYQAFPDWVVGWAQSLPEIWRGAAQVPLERHKGAIPVIIRRSDKLKGRHGHQVFLLNGPGPWPPLPKARDGRRARNEWAAVIWSLWRWSRGVPICDLIAALPPHVRALPALERGFRRL